VLVLGVAVVALRRIRPAFDGRVLAILFFPGCNERRRPSIRAYSRLGAVVVPLALAAGLFAAGAILTRS
jgi:hypothetical protein